MFQALINAIWFTYKFIYPAFFTPSLSDRYEFTKFSESISTNAALIYWMIFNSIIFKSFEH